MMFALGFFVSGLLWLAFSVALVRRARRLTERRLLAGIATRRAEFDSECDELRARHAVQMHRLEREVSRILDQATAHRLEADLKERDIHALRAELGAREEDMRDAEVRLTKEREVVQDLERRHAEAGSSLRATQHALKLEGKRRAIAEEGLDEMSVIADQRRMALSTLRVENDTLRARLGEPPGTPLPIELESERPRRIAAIEDDDETADVETPGTEAPDLPDLPAGGSVVPLPTRARQQAAESPEKSAAVMADATRDLQRIAGEGEGRLASGVWQASASPAPQLPIATAPGDTNVGELVALRLATPSAPVPTNGEDKTGTGTEADDDGAETRFFEALAEIRALKRAANQAGE